MYINYLEFFYMEYLSILSHLFIYLFIYISMELHLFYTLGYNPVPLYFFCCSSFPSFGHWKLFHLPSVPL